MQSPPWYSQRWPWLLIAAPLVAVVASVITAVLAVSGADSLVSDDYYRRGVAINAELARRAEARRLGIEVTLHRHPDRNRIELLVRGNPAVEWPPVIGIRLIDPAQARFDHRFNAAQTAPGHYEAAAGTLEARRWHVVVETTRWQVRGRWNGLGQVEIDAR